MLIGLDKLLYAFVRWNFLDMEQIEQGSRKYGHRILKKSQGFFSLSLIGDVLFFLVHKSMLLWSCMSKRGYYGLTSLTYSCWVI